MSPTYSQYLDTYFLELEGTALEKPVKFSLRELEAMDDIIIRDSYTYIGEHQHEGLDLWKLISQKAGLKKGAELTSVKVIASDGFSRDVLSVFGKEALEKGIADGLERKIIILAYAGDGNPLVPDTSSDGYTSGNEGGPIRMITHMNQGACLKNVVKVVVDGNVTAAPNASFIDIVGHWAQEHIEYLYSKGITEGTETINSAPIIHLQGQNLSVPGKHLKDIDLGSASTGIFKDIEDGQWYTDYVNWAGAKIFLQVLKMTISGPNDVITREEMAVTIYNFAKAMGIELGTVAEEIVFTDASSISEWAKDAVKAVQLSGIINGKPDGSFDPQGQSTRAEASKIIRMIMEKCNTKTRTGSPSACSALHTEVNYEK